RAHGGRNEVGGAAKPLRELENLLGLTLRQRSYLIQELTGGQAVEPRQNDGRLGVEARVERIQELLECNVRVRGHRMHQVGVLNRLDIEAKRGRGESTQVGRVGDTWRALRLRGLHYGEAGRRERRGPGRAGSHRRQRRRLEAERQEARRGRLTGGTR